MYIMFAVLFVSGAINTIRNESHLISGEFSKLYKLVIFIYVYLIKKV